MACPKTSTRCGGNCHGELNLAVVLFAVQAFLSLCQGNHYQFDTLRRAKHSSMMCLYHLHNPTAPAFSCTCNVCNQEIEPGQGFRCTVCSDFDMCARCKARGLVVHPHPLAVSYRPWYYFFVLL